LKMEVICTRADECMALGLDCHHMDVHTWDLACLGQCPEALGESMDCVVASSGEPVKELNFDDD